jgi:hypothetical protein
LAGLTTAVSLSARVGAPGVGYGVRSTTLVPD